jgi:hypothetical protein
MSQVIMSAGKLGFFVHTFHEKIRNIYFGYLFKISYLDANKKIITAKIL